MKRFCLALLALCCLVASLAHGTSTELKQTRLYVNVYLGLRWVGEYSGDRLRACPAEDDTTGECKAMVYIGGPRFLWYLDPDSTDVYTVYETGGAGGDTAIAHLDRWWVWDTKASENFVGNSRAIVDGAVAKVDLAANSVDSTKVVDGSISGADMKTNTITPNKMKGATNTFDIAGGASFDTLKVDVLMSPTLTSATASTQISVLRKLRITQGDFLADRNVTLGDGTGTDVINSKGDFYTENDMYFGNGVGDLASFWNAATFHTGGDTTTTTQFSNGFIRLTGAVRSFSMTSGDGTAKTFAFPGVLTADCSCWLNNTSATVTDITAAGVSIPSNGHIRINRVSAPISTITYHVMCFKR